MFGRLSYEMHMVLYPLVGGTTYFLYNTWSQKSSAAQAIIDEEAMPKLKTVDPDSFNPFSPIPFHNNAELRYRFAGVRMHQYIDSKTQMNLDNYQYKTYYDVYDHAGKK